MAGPAMWVVERSASRVFLFGETVGVRRDDAWCTDPIRAAFEDSRELWCEVPDAGAVTRSPLLAEHGLSAVPLSSRLDSADLGRVQEVARAVGLDPATLDGLRPWLAGQLLEHTYRSHVHVDTEAGVQEVLVRRASDAGKPISSEFETDALLAMFGRLEAAVEIEYLMWTVDRVAAGRKEIDRQVDAWMAGDGSVVEQQVATLRSDRPRLHQWLLADRNRAWVPRVEAMLDRSGSTFVLVGDSHLPGDDGIPALLARSGLQARRAT